MERSDAAPAVDVPAALAQNPHCLFCKEPLQPSPRDDMSWVGPSGARACDRSLTGQHMPAVEDDVTTRAGRRGRIPGKDV